MASSFLTGSTVGNELIATQPWALEQIENSVLFEKGEGENSVVQKGLNNQAISEGTIVLGSNNSAGLKGYYWNYVNLTDKTIYLSNENTALLDTEPEVDTAFENPYKVGDVYSFHDNANYYNCGTITAIDYNKVTVDILPIEEIKVDEPARKYYFYVFGIEETN